jgi:hypothetical protein
LYQDPKSVRGVLRCGKLLIVAILAMTVSGCGSGGVPLGKVSGHVTKAGKPMADITVKFDPVGGGRSSIGLTDPSGYYELIFSDRKGALLGNHKVTVETRATVDNGGVVVSPAKVYLTVERQVESGSNTFDFEIADRGK